MKNLRGKRVFVTGGARGIGFAIADQFAAEGAEIILTDLKQEDLDEAKDKLARVGARCHTYVLDVTDHAAIKEVHERVRGEVGSVDVLVNNAGIVSGGPFLEVPLEKHLKTYEVNLLALVAVTHAFLPDLIDGPEGHLINIASASGLIALPNGSTYASSKWGVIGFSESIRIEMQRQGARHVGVTTVSPSYVSTGMFEGVKAPLLTPWLTPEVLAKKVMIAVRDNRPEVLEPWLVKITPAVMGTLPRKVSDLVADILGASKSMESWRGHGR